MSIKNIGFILLVVSFVSAQTNELPNLELRKAKEEAEVKDQVENILNVALGEGHNSIVNVNIVYTGGELIKEIKHTTPAKDNDLPWMKLAPGIPNFKVTNTTKDQRTVEKRTPIKRIRKIWITINAKYGQPILDQIKKTIIDQLNLKTKEKGGREVLEFNKLNFKTASPIVSSFTKDKWNIILLMLAFAMLVFIIFLFGPVRGFFNSILRAMQRGREINVGMEGASPAAALAGGGELATAGGGNAALGSGKGSGSSSETEEGVSEEGEVVVEGSVKKKIKQPFSFIKKENIKNLVYLVQEEPPEIIALIMTYLPPEESAELMSYLPTELQGKVALALATVKQASAESVIRTEENIKRKIDFLIGGIERFTNILDRVDSDTKKEILNALSKENPVLAERVRREVFMFEDITDLDDLALQNVLREIKISDLAKALKDAPSELINKVKANISAGAATLLEEEIELQGVLTETQISDERRKIVDTVRRLEKEGVISIKKESENEKKKIKLEKIETIDDKITYGNKSNEKGISLAGKKDSDTVEERKVTLSDYAKKQGPRFSMKNVFKEVTDNKSSSKKQKPLVKEKLFRPKLNNTSSDSKIAKELYQKGMELYKKRDYDNALKELEKSVKNMPAFWQAFQAIGNCYCAKGMAGEAVKAYEKSLLINANNSGLKDWLEKYKKKQGIS